MAEKTDVRRKIRRLEQVKTWQLVVVLLMVGFVAATFLRLNNVGMIERRDAVHAAETSGDDEQLERRLYDLQRYVSSHMNTDPGKIALELKYQRDNEKQKEKFQEAAKSAGNSDVVSKVVAHCDAIGRQQGWRWTNSADPRYVACINDEWAKYPAASQSDLNYKPLPTAPYYHTFVSPLWSPDFAGWSVLVCLMITLIIIGRLVTLGVLHLLLKRHYRQF